ncbi:mannose-6-phosphate isomerase, class I [Arthrobacter sp. zg-Y20]|uniref:mannose-6-phosphate isomerase, class I n=1 Tax=unclassified Arthrobacter TaxID=235627 RepID=UPI001D15AFED|nr:MULTISPECIES: mannose-6-phosphate isomerase, class I [unclassified Arthrobacter]MCC3277190.1 mannose-6-phosphate isomerase, class I [Arthrobacter sp. zg-Y20]MDK1317349.1 mannose-6-phosphate isomerase, class I [Arthrobacter sp. zg.Y20]WIB07127.1 mannose-6-phosphate isomerase, class I [Arthrobacter sp. zg-Y20]
MYLLRNTLRPYAWGSTTAMAELFGREPSGDPEAELWIGAHPGAPSALVPPVDGAQTLDELIALDPEAALGADTAARFGGELPFLAKILAAGSPLSLQVHPTPAQARAGYAAEEETGVDRGARERNYKDGNHKPEMIFALTPFEALCGFRNPEEAAQVFRAVNGAIAAEGRPVPELLEWIVAELSSGHPAADRLQSVFRTILSDGESVRPAVEEAAAASALLSAAGTEFARELTTVAELHGFYPGDPGVLISLLLNRASLKSGEAIYLPAGNVHAYLSGLGVEVMAASDNVLRGGLTPKHVDVPELLRTVDFRPLGIPSLTAGHTADGQEVFRPPFEEFQLQRIELAQGPDTGRDLPAEVPVLQNGPAVVISVRGNVALSSPAGSLVLEPGQSAFLPAGDAPAFLRLASDSAQHDDAALAFAVTVGSAPANGGDEPRLDLPA